MSQMSAKTVVNSVGAVATLIVLTWVGYAALTSDEPDICEGRYPVSTRLSLTGDTGQPATQSELQARLGSSEWGILNNARIVSGADDDGQLALAVTLEKGTSSGYKDDQTRGGIGFTWRPDGMQEGKPKAACLSYRLFMPKTMKFANGGVLPGLSLGPAFDPRGEPIVGSGAVARPSWNREGMIFVGLQFATSEGWKNPVALKSPNKWPLGRWINVEQEIILNDVGKKNGIIRLWVDGKLAGEANTLSLRAEDPMALSSVVADIHYGSITINGEAPETAEIRLSPFVVRWQ